MTQVRGVTSWPVEWRKATRVGWSKVALGVLLSLSMMAAATPLFLRAEYGWGRLALSCGSFFASYAWLVYSAVVDAKGRGIARVSGMLVDSRRERATVLPCSSAVTGGIYLAIASSILFIIFLPYVDKQSQSNPNAMLWSLTAKFCLAFPVVMFVSAFLRKRYKIGVGLSPRGIYHWRWFGCAFYPWENITAIDVEGWRKGRSGYFLVWRSWDSSTRKPNKEENWLGRRVDFRESGQRCQAGALAVDPRKTLGLIRFYLEHPELRDELGTEQALDRLASTDHLGPPAGRNAAPDSKPESSDSKPDSAPFDPPESSVSDLPATRAPDPPETKAPALIALRPRTLTYDSRHTRR